VLLVGVSMTALRATPLYRNRGPLASGLGVDAGKASEILVASNGRDTVVLTRSTDGAVTVTGRRHGSPSGLPPALAKQIDLIPRDAQIWAVGAGSTELESLAPSEGNLANLATALRLVDTLRASADLRKGVKIDATALCRSEEDAESLAGAVQVLTGLARLSASVEARHALDGVRLEREHSTVRIEVSVSEETAEKLSGEGSRLPHRP
jgi:hypothetical protein